MPAISNVFSGKDGTAKQSGGAHICELTKWNFEPKVAVPKWASNTTSGVKTGVAGTHDSSGTIEAKVDGTVKMPFRPGSTVELELHADQTGANYIKVTAIIEGAPIDCQINENGDPLTYTYRFEGISRAVYYGIFWNGAGSSGV